MATELPEKGDKKKCHPRELYPAKMSSTKPTRHLKHITPKRIMIQESRQNPSQCENDTESLSHPHILNKIVEEVLCQNQKDQKR